MWCVIIIVYGDSDADAGYRRDPDWSKYTSRRRYNYLSSIRPKNSQYHQPKKTSKQPNKSFAKRISPSRKNPPLLSAAHQYPANTGQPLGVLLSVGDLRKTYNKKPLQGQKNVSKKPTRINDKHSQKILKKKGRGERMKVKLIRRKPAAPVSKAPQKTFHSKQGSSRQGPFIRGSINDELYDRIFSDFYPSGTIGAALLGSNTNKKTFLTRPKKNASKGKPKRPNKRPSGYKSPKKPSRPQSSYKPAKKPQQSYKPASKPQQSYRPAKKPKQSYKPPAKKPQQSYKPAKPQTSYKPSKPEPAYTPTKAQSSYDPPAQSYQPSEPVYKPEPELEPSYVPKPPEKYKPEPQFDHSYEPPASSSYKPPAVDYNQPEYGTEVTSYKPPSNSYDPQQSVNDFPNFPMPDFSSFLQASFEPDFTFDIPKLNSKIIK